MNLLISLPGEISKTLGVWIEKSRVRARREALLLKLVQWQIDELQYQIQTVGIPEHPDLPNALETDISDEDRQLHLNVQKAMEDISELKTSNQGRVSFAILHFIYKRLGDVLATRTLLEIRMEEKSRKRLSAEDYITAVLEPRMVLFESHPTIGHDVSVWRQVMDDLWDKEGTSVDVRLEETKKFVNRTRSRIADVNFYRDSVRKIQQELAKEFRWASNPRRMPVGNAVAPLVEKFNSLSKKCDVKRIAEDEDAEPIKYGGVFEKLLEIMDRICNAYWKVVT